jgi:hypothetical protein
MQYGLLLERCFNRLKQWSGIAMRSDKTARNYHAARCLAATLLWAASVPEASTAGADETPGSGQDSRVATYSA